MAREGSFRSVIPQAADKIEQEVFELVDWVAVGIEGNAATDAPIGPTGKLAGSVEKKPTTRANGVVEGEVVASAEYAAYVNYGTGAAGASSAVPGRTEEIRYTSGWKGMAARPFFSSAVENGRNELVRGMHRIEGELPRL